MIWLQVVDIEEKLDILIKAYMEDRDRFLALPLPANPKPKIHSISPSHSHNLHQPHNQHMIDVWKRTATLSVHPELVSPGAAGAAASATATSVGTGLDRLDSNETALTSTQTTTTTTDAIATQTNLPHTQHTATNTKVRPGDLL